MKTDQELLGHAKLMLNIQMPSYEDCWQDGFDSCQNDLDESDNPYDEDSAQYIQWQEGWWADCLNETGAFDNVPAESQQAANDVNIIQEPIAANAAISPRRYLRRLLAIGGAILFAMLCFELVEIAI